MNFHSDEWIMQRVQEHYNEALEHFPEDRIVGIYYQGSANYQMDYADSDVDTKLIVAPTFQELAMKTKEISTTHIRANDEHIDFKDLRLYCQIFRKQNMNFLEILWTKYCLINPMYAAEWNRLVNAREEIARYAPVLAVKAMTGVAKEKYFAMEHEYPSRMEWIKKFSYDPKQTHHLLRVREYMKRYISGESYERCLIPQDTEYLIEVKKGLYQLDEARKVAKEAITDVDRMCNSFSSEHENIVNSTIDDLIDDVQYNIMKIAIQKEFEKEA